eukprot:GHVO01066593.1.p1 GENE.GHVO01066593.1~~GHVO01066593.1.p1  ORF type:complete len:104 (+),score=3.44 GHVO01066593.1:478-789(+)
MHKLLSARYFWSTITVDCLYCQRRKPHRVDRKPKEGESEPFETVALDHQHVVWKNEKFIALTIVKLLCVRVKTLPLQQIFLCNIGLHVGVSYRQMKAQYVHQR